MEATITKNFSLYPSDLRVVRKLAEQIARKNGGQADSLALRTIIREWAELKRTAEPQNCKEQEPTP